MSKEVLCNITPPNSPTWTDKNTSQDDDHGLEKFECALTPRWFVCLGEAKVEKVNLHDNSYLQNKENHIFDDILKDISKNIGCKTTSLFNNSFDLATVFLYDCEILFRLVRSAILYLHDAAKLRHTDLHTLADFHSTRDHFKARQNCVRMFMCLREYLSCLYVPRHGWIVNNALIEIEQQLNGFRLFLRRLSDLPEYVMHHSAHSQGDKCTEASYHLFHGQLDMLWLHLTSVYLVDQCRRVAVDETSASQQSQASSISATADKLGQNIVALIADLVQLSVLRFEKMDIRSLLIKSPFSCSCVTELWMLVSVMANRLHGKGISENFWSCFNRVMEGFFNSRGQNQKPNCRTLVQSVTHPCSNPHGFALWFLKHIAMVHSYNEECRCAVPVDNYNLLESIMKGLLSSDVSEAHMRVYLTFVEKILIKYWEPDTKTIILLWEYFQKKLNSTFFVPGSSIDSIAVMSQSVAGMVKQVKSRLSTVSSSDNSFQMFLRILGLYLQRVSALGQTQHWNQIRGRIYSKLSTSKVNALNETGLYHLVALFLTLAVTADLNEVSKKLQSLLSSLPDAELDVSVRRLVWRSHLSVCLLMAERGQDVTPALAPLTESLGQQHMDVSLYRTFFEGLKDILDVSACLKVDYTMLVGAWTSKYLADCSPNDSSRLLETLDLLMMRVQSQPLDHEKFQCSVWQHLSPYLRQRVSEDNPPLQLADVCLHLCLPHWDTGREVVHLMLLNYTTRTSLVRRFLSKLVQNNELLAALKAAQPSSPESHEVLIIKSWVRCSLLSLDFNDGELSRVTNYITYLPFIAGISMDLPSATDPLVHFIVNVSNKYKAAKDYDYLEKDNSLELSQCTLETSQYNFLVENVTSGNEIFHFFVILCVSFTRMNSIQDICERSGMRQLMSRVLTGLDKWVEPHVRQPKSPELLSRVYHVVGLVVHLLPTFIYLKSRPNTVLKGVLDIMFLPQSAYRQDYDPPLKAVIAAEIHLYINGLADLCVMQDGYIDRCIQDLIKIYLPIVSSLNQCRLHECVQRADNSVKLILNTVCLTFIKRKTSNPQPHCAQALKFLRSVVKLYSRNSSVMVIFVDQCFEHVCDVIMFCDDFHHAKNIAREVMVLIFESYCFGDELSIRIIQKFDNLCREYLPFLPKKLFALFLEVMKHRPELISRYLPDLLSHVRTVEQKRGFTHDHSLRVYVEELENALKNIRKGP